MRNTQWMALAIVIATALCAVSVLGLSTGTYIYFNIPDLVPPALENISVNVTNSSAAIYWDTTKAANSYIGYGLTPSFGDSSYNYSYVYGRDISLSGLQDGTLYYYYLKSCDSIGNCNQTDTLNFTTLANPLSVLNITTEPVLPFVNNATFENVSINLTSSVYPINLTFTLYNSTGGIFGSLGPIQINSSADLPVTFPIPGGLPDGNYTINLTAVDKHGQTDTEIVGTFEVITPDTTPPVITNVTTFPTGPIPNNGTAENASVNFTTSEYPTIITFTLYNSTGTPVDTYGPIQINSSTDLPITYPIPAGLTDGNYTLNLTARDPSNNTNTTFVTLIIVDTPPIISGVTTTSITNDTAVSQWNTDKPANSTITLSPAGGPTVVITDGTQTTTHTIPISGLLNATIYYYNITSCDISGNCATNGVFNFTTTQNIEILPPTITNVTTFPTGPIPNNGSTEPVNINLTSSEYPINITFTLYNSTGIPVDTYGPIQINSSTDLPITYPIPAGLTDGNYTLNLSATNENGTTTTFITIITVDTPPIITGVTTTSITNDTAVSDWNTNKPTNSTVTISPASGPTVVFTDGTLTTSHNIPLTGLLNATTYYYNVTSCDATNSCTTSGTYSFTTAQDTQVLPPAIINITTSPSGPIFNNGSASNTSVNFTSDQYPINLTFTLYNETGWPVDIYGPVQINSSTDLPITYPIPGGLTDGNYTLNLTATNENGTTTTYITTIIVHTPDTTPPIITNVTTFPTGPIPNNGSQENTTVNLTSSEYPINITFTLYNSTGIPIDTFGPVTITDPSQLPVLFPIPADLPDGNYTLNLTATDPAGNNGTVYVTTIIVTTPDTTPPVITNVTTFPTGPIPNNGTAENTTINFTTSEYPTIITFTLYNSTGSPIDTYGPITINSSSDLPVIFPIPSGLTDGNYTLNLSAKDTSNNTNNTFVTIITVDTPPIISGVTTTSITNDTAVSDWNTDKPANSTLIISPPGGPTLIFTDGTLTTSHNIPLNGLLNATTYYYNVTSCDPAGTCTTSGVYNFTTQQNAQVLPPAITNITTSPTGPILNNGSTEPVSINLTSNQYPINITFTLYNSTGTPVDTYGPIQINSSTDLPITYPIPAGLTDGNYTLNLTATNENGTTTKYITTIIVTTPDITPPTISGVTTLNITNESAKISSTTSEPANTTITYGATTTLGSSTSDPAFTTAHNVSLSGLLNGTLYYYNVTSCDPSGNCATSGVYNFTTSQNTATPDTTPPVITNVTTFPTGPIPNNGSQENTTVNLTSSEYPINITFTLYNSTGIPIDTFGPVTITNASQLPTIFPIPGSLPDGNYTLNLTATDPSGNNGTIYITTIIVTTPDTTPPIITHVTTFPTGPIPNNGSQENASVNFTTSEYPTIITFTLYNDTGSPIDTYGPIQINSSTDLPITYPIPAGLTDGNYTLNLTARDPSNNTNTTFVTLIIVDTPPIINGVGTISITNSTATSTWNTDKPANSTVTISPAGGPIVIFIDGTLTTSHSIPLTGLTNATTYYYNVTSCDPAGTCTTSGVYNFTTTQNIEILPPTITNVTTFPTGPIPNNGSTEPVNINLTSSEYPINITFTLYNSTGIPIDTYGPIQINSSTDLPITFPIPGGLTNGNYTLNLTATDPNGTTTKYVTTIIVTTPDTTPPVVSQITPTSGNEDTPIDFTATVTDNVGVANCVLLVNNAPAGIMTLTGITANKTMTFNTPGLYVLSANCTDTSGNSAKNDTAVLIHDITLPTVTIISPVATVYNYTSIPINITAADNVAIDKLFFSYNDSLGNQSANMSWTTLINWVFSDNAVTTLHAYANDTSGNIGTTTVVFTINTTVPPDIIPPTISSVTAIAITNESAKISSITDEAANTTITYGTTTSLGSTTTSPLFQTAHNVSLTGLQNDTLYYYNVTSCDPSGNCATSGPFSFTTLQNVPPPDTTPPVVSRISPTSGNEDTPIDFTATVTDNVGVTNCVLLVNGAPSGTMTLVGTTTNKTLTFNTPGIYALSANCTDAAGNSAKNDTVVIINDVTPPTVTIVSPTATAYNTTTIAVNISVTDNVAYDKIFFSFNDSLGNQSANMSWTTLVNFAFSDHSTITLFAYANDTSGNVGGSVVKFSINTSIPPPIISSVTVISITNESATITSTTDKAANMTVTFGTTPALGTVVTDTSFMTTHNVSLAGLQNNTLYYYNVTSCDPSGNCATSGPFSFTTLNNAAVNIPPSITLITPVNASMQSSHNVMFAFNATDAHPILSCTLFVDGVIRHVALAQSRAMQMFTIGNMADGNHTWHVTCFDGLDYNTSDSWQFEVSVPPSTPGGHGPPVVPPTPVNKTCTPDWQCSDFGACESGYQDRQCTDLNACNITESMPPLLTNCTVPPVIPPPITPPTTPGTPQGGKSGILEKPAVPTVRPVLIGTGIVMESISGISVTVLIGTIMLALLATGAAGSLLFLRRKEEMEDFYGIETGQDTTYLPVESVEECEQILKKLFEGGSTKKHSPFLVHLCKRALDDARREPLLDNSAEIVKGHIDWISARMLSHVARSMGSAMLANAPVTLDEKEHSRFWEFGAEPSKEDYPEVASVTTTSKSEIHHVTVAQKEDAHRVLKLLREGTCLVAVELTIFNDDDAKAVLRAIRKTARANNGDVVAMGGHWYLATSDMTIERHTEENNGTQ